MTLPYPKKLEMVGECYGPLLTLLKDTLIRPAELSARWRLQEAHLGTLRRRGLGPPWLRLPTMKAAGAIRYRTSDIVAAELAGSDGPITLDRVVLVISACDFLTEAERAAVIDRLRTTLQ